VSAETHGAAFDRSLQARRMQAVIEQVRAAGARSVLDAGCGDGDLLVRLAGLPGVERIVGLDPDPAKIVAARAALGLESHWACPRLCLEPVSLFEYARAPERFDVCTLVEVIEHLDPGRLEALERALFKQIRPRVVVLTTPNRDYNAVLGMPPGSFRHPDHRFEWGRARFCEWSQRVASGHGLRVAFAGIGESDPVLGAPTQMAVFVRN
jgi:SAM-dependent methyltransferase